MEGLENILDISTIRDLKTVFNESNAILKRLDGRLKDFADNAKTYIIRPRILLENMDHHNCRKA